jgi:hypothetical protein
MIVQEARWWSFETCALFVELDADIMNDEWEYVKKATC